MKLPGRGVQDGLHVLLGAFVVDGGEVDCPLSGGCHHLLAQLLSRAGVEVAVAQPPVEAHQGGHHREPRDQSTTEAAVRPGRGLVGRRRVGALIGHGSKATGAAAGNVQCTPRLRGTP